MSCISLQCFITLCLLRLLYTIVFANWCKAIKVGIKILVVIESQSSRTMSFKNQCNLTGILLTIQWGAYPMKITC